MNDQLQQALAEILQKANSGIDSGIAFLSTEIPDVVQQLLLWKLCESIILFVFGVGCFYASWITYKKGIEIFMRESAKQYGGYEELSLLMFVVSAIAFACALCNVFSIVDAVQIAVAPKIYLIEYAAKLVK